jgi:chromosome partitioning protein
MNRIALLSLKGGVGKTLSSIALASILSERSPTALLDLDPEGSARAWAAAGPLPFRVIAPWESFPEEILQVVIDTPPNDRKTMTGVAESVNYIIVPVRVGAQEVDRLQPTLEALAAIRLQSGAKLGVIITDAGRDGLTAAMPEVLEANNLPVLGVVHHRVGYQRAFGQRIPDDLLEPYRAILKEIGL